MNILLLTHHSIVIDKGSLRSSVSDQLKCHFFMNPPLTHLTPYDTVIYNKKYIFGLQQLFQAQSSYSFWNFLSDKSKNEGKRSIFCYS